MSEEKVAHESSERISDKLVLGNILYVVAILMLLFEVPSRLIQDYEHLKFEHAGFWSWLFFWLFCGYFIVVLFATAMLSIEFIRVYAPESSSIALYHRHTQRTYNELFKVSASSINELLNREIDAAVETEKARTGAVKENDRRKLEAARDRIIKLVQGRD